MHVKEKTGDGLKQDSQDVEHAGIRLNCLRASFRLGREFWLLLLTTFLFNLGASVFFFLYNLLLLDLGYREQSLGAFASAMAIGSVIGTIPIWFLVRGAGHTRTLIVCLLGMACALLARASLTWEFAQALLALLHGVFLCGWVVCLSPAVAAVVDEPGRPAAFSLLFAVAVVTGSLGGMLGGHLPGWCQRVEAHYFLSAISAVTAKRIALTCASLFTALAALPLSGLTRKPAPFASTWVPRPSRALLRFLLASALWAAALGAFNPFVNVYFTRYLGVQTTHLGNFFSLAQLVQAGAVLLVPLVIRRTGLLRAISSIQLTSAVALALLASSRNLLRDEIVFAAFLSTQHMCEPAMQTLLMNTVDDAERSGAAMMSFLTVSLAQAAAAVVAGSAFTRRGYPPVLFTIALVTLGAAAGFQVLCAPKRSAVSRNA